MELEDCNVEGDNPGLHLSILSARSGPWSESNPEESWMFISEDISGFTSKESFKVDTCNVDKQGSRQRELTRELS